MISFAPVTICFTYFKSLALVNLEAALHSVRQQDLSRVEALVIVDNNTEDSLADIEALVNGLEFPVPVNISSFKHGDASKTHSWSTNAAVRRSFTPWVLFTRADYLLDFDLVSQFLAVVDSKPGGWDGFVTSNVYHLGVDVGVCNETDWRQIGPRSLRRLPGTEESYTNIDTGVWMARRRSFERVRGLDESLTAWGHAQTHFQYKLHASGTEFVRVPEAMFYHPQHSAVREIEVAHQQLIERGIDIKELWSRYEGMQPYR